MRGDGGTAINLGSAIGTAWEDYFIVGVYRASTGTKEIWINGVLIATSTVDIGAITLNTTDVAVLSRNSPIQHLSGRMYVGGIYDRALTAREIRSLTDNPWQVYESEPIEVYWVGAGGTTVDCTPGTATASGTSAALDVAVNASVGTATASGTSAKIDEAVNASVGTATTNGTTAKLDVTINASVGTATALGVTGVIDAGGGTTIDCTVGTATASGARAAIDEHIAASVGTATASGVPCTFLGDVVADVPTGCGPDRDDSSAERFSDDKSGWRKPQWVREREQLAAATKVSIEPPDAEPRRAPPVAESRLAPALSDSGNASVAPGLERALSQDMAAAITEQPADAPAQQAAAVDLDRARIAAKRRQQRELEQIMTVLMMAA